MLQMSGFQVCSGKTGILLFSPTENNSNFNFHCQVGWSLGFGCHDNSSHILIFCEKLSRHLWKSFFEGGGDGAVDDEVGGEVEHDEEVGHRLEAHHPEGRDVLIELLHTSNLLLCVGKNYKRRRNWFDLYPHLRERQQGRRGRSWGRCRRCAWRRWRRESPPGWTHSAAACSAARSESEHRTIKNYYLQKNICKIYYVRIVRV